MKFVFRKATKKDIPALGRMMREVWETMEQKEWFAQYDAEKYITDLFNTRKGDVWRNFHSLPTWTQLSYILSTGAKACNRN